MRKNQSNKFFVYSALICTILILFSSCHYNYNISTQAGKVGDFLEEKNYTVDGLRIEQYRNFTRIKDKFDILSNADTVFRRANKETYKYDINLSLVEVTFNKKRVPLLFNKPLTKLNEYSYTDGDYVYNFDTITDITTITNADGTQTSTFNEKLIINNPFPRTLVLVFDKDVMYYDPSITQDSPMLMNRSIVLGNSTARDLYQRNNTMGTQSTRYYTASATLAANGNVLYSYGTSSDTQDVGAWLTADDNNDYYLSIWNLSKKNTPTMVSATALEASGASATPAGWVSYWNGSNNGMVIYDDGTTTNNALAFRYIKNGKFVRNEVLITYPQPSAAAGGAVREVLLNCEERVGYSEVACVTVTDGAGDTGALIAFVYNYTSNTTYWTYVTNTSLSFNLSASYVRASDLAWTGDYKHLIITSGHKTGANAGQIISLVYNRSINVTTPMKKITDTCSNCAVNTNRMCRMPTINNGVFFMMERYNGNTPGTAGVILINNSIKSGQPDEEFDMYRDSGENNWNVNCFAEEGLGADQVVATWIIAGTSRNLTYLVYFPENNSWSDTDLDNNVGSYSSNAPYTSNSISSHIVQPCAWRNGGRICADFITTDGDSDTYYNTVWNGSVLNGIPIEIDVSAVSTGRFAASVLFQRIPKVAGVAKPYYWVQISNKQNSTNKDSSYITITTTGNFTGAAFYKNGTLMQNTSSKTYNYTSLSPSSSYNFTIRAYYNATIFNKTQLLIRTPVSDATWNIQWYSPTVNSDHTNNTNVVYQANVTIYNQAVNLNFTFDPPTQSTKILLVRDLGGVGGDANCNPASQEGNAWNYLTNNSHKNFSCYYEIDDDNAYANYTAFQAEYEAGAFGVMVVFSTANSGSNAYKWRNLTYPVVVLGDSAHLGMSTCTSDDVQAGLSVIDVLNITHSVSDHYTSTGLTDYGSATTSIGCVGPGTGMIRIAERASTNNPVFGLYENQSLMVGDFPAPARRAWSGARTETWSNYVLNTTLTVVKIIDWLSYGFESPAAATKTGVIPACPDSPFCTGATHPFNLTLAIGSHIINLTVNATGEIGTTHGFFVTATQLEDGTKENSTSTINITIIAPEEEQVTQIQGSAVTVILKTIEQYWE